MEWQVLAWNTPSIDFYKRLGAWHQADWLPFRLDDEALHAVGLSRVVVAVNTLDRNVENALQPCRWNSAVRTVQRDGEARMRPPHTLSTWHVR